MSHNAWFILFSILLVLVIGDVILRDSQNVLFLLKKLLDLVEYIAFWR